MHICASTCVNVPAHVIYRPMCVSVLVDMVVIFSDRLYVPCTTYSLTAWRMKVCDSLSVSKYQLQVVGGRGAGRTTVHFMWDISCIYCAFYWRSFYFVCFVVYFTHGQHVQSCPVGAAMTYVLHWFMRQSCFYQCTLFVAPVIFWEEIISESINARSFLLHVVLNFACTYNYIYDLVPKGVHENRTKGVENKVDDTLKLVVFLECAQC